MEIITKVAGPIAGDDSNQLDSSKITVDYISTALVENVFQHSAFLAVNGVVARTVNRSDVDIILKFNQLAIRTPGGHYQQLHYQKPGTIIVNIVNL